MGVARYSPSPSRKSGSDPFCVIVELEIMGGGRRSAYRGLLLPRWTELRLGCGDWRIVSYDLVVLFLIGGCRGGSPYGQRSSFGGRVPRLWGARRRPARGWSRGGRCPRRGRSDRRGIHARGQQWLGTLSLLRRPGGARTIPCRIASRREGFGLCRRPLPGGLAFRRGIGSGGPAASRLANCARAAAFAASALTRSASAARITSSS